MARERTAEPGAAPRSTRLSRRAFARQIAGLGAVTLLATCGGQLVTLSPTPTPKLRRIGYLSGNARTSVEELSLPFLQELRDLGYVEGRDIEVVFRIADNAMEKLPAMVTDLINMPVDVILAEAGQAQRAAKAATSTVPVVFVLATDPIGEGFVVSHAHPGGNMTGVVTLSTPLAPKRVERLIETVPGLRRLAVLWNANQGDTMKKGQVIPTEDAARSLGLETQTFGVRNSAELDGALDTVLRQRLDGVLMLPALSVSPRWDQVPEFAAKSRLPQIYADVQMAKAGGLMHLGANYATLHRRAADFVDRILKGARPADLPVEEPAQFDFIVNLGAARRLGLTIPDSVLRQATDVIH